MKILGLTGDIASGKSTVARLLVARGVTHIDADLLVRELYGQPDFARLLARNFGDILEDSGEVSRVKLSALVFSDGEKLRELEALVHPAVATLRTRRLSELRAQGVSEVVLEAVKLLESGQGDVCDEIWYVHVLPSVQLERLMQNRGLAQECAKARLLAQPGHKTKEKWAGRVPLVWVENNGSLAQLAAKVQTLWSRFEGV